MEATCLERAVFAMPDGARGFFMQLPIEEGQLTPYLFVEASCRCARACTPLVCARGSRASTCVCVRLCARGGVFAAACARLCVSDCGRGCLLADTRVLAAAPGARACERVLANVCVCFGESFPSGR
eukprot:6177757-Pleurochrysis_carterae.AAC.1